MTEPGTGGAEHVLDNAVWAALTGPHARFAEVRGRAARYQPDVTPFAAVPDPRAADDRSWSDLAAVSGAGATLVLSAAGLVLPAGWEVYVQEEGRQLIGVGIEADSDSEAELLTAEDVPEMLDLVARTKPGPLLARTAQLGRYLGIRREGRLVSMAGERLRVPGWTEISAVCTDEAYRGRGLASRLVSAVVAGVLERGDTPFLHIRPENTEASRVYEHLGFKERRTVTFAFVRVPDNAV